MTSKEFKEKFREIFLKHFESHIIREIEDACIQNDLFIAGKLFLPLLEYTLHDCNDAGIWVLSSEILEVGREYFCNRNEVTGYWETEISNNNYMLDFARRRRDFENEEALAAKEAETKKKHPNNGKAATLAAKINFNRLNILNLTIREFFMKTAAQNPKDIDRVKFVFETEAAEFIEFLSHVFLPCTPEEIKKALLQEIEPLRSNSNLLADLDNLILKQLTEDPSKFERIVELTDELPSQEEIPEPAIKPLEIRTPELDTKTMTVEFKNRVYQITTEGIIDAAEKLKGEFDETLLQNNFGKLLLQMHIHCRDLKVQDKFHTFVEKALKHYQTLYHPTIRQEEKSEEDRKNDVIYHLLNILNGNLGNSKKVLQMQRIKSTVRNPDGTISVVYL